MLERPYTILSCGVSIDGYLDAATPERLMLSNEDDLRRVDAVRAEADAILVGAETVRHDNPRLLVRDEQLRECRRARGLSEQPMKITVTRGGRLDPAAHFFTTGDCEKVVYCHNGAVAEARARLGAVAAVVDAGDGVEMFDLAHDLWRRGVRRLMVEGGGQIHTQFLTAGLADELHLVVAPFFVGDPRAHRFVGAGAFPWHAGHRARLAETRQMGDVVLLRYAFTGAEAS
ncbi:RibD family protein [Nocardioides sp.]|uniref:RibD family protein n=1 Tax=Nocardioides sp. TaxID=35761 RepID=UPI002ED2724C